MSTSLNHKQLLSELGLEELSEVATLDNLPLSKEVSEICRQKSVKTYAEDTACSDNSII